jgi:hypothetical protein
MIQRILKVSYNPSPLDFLLCLSNVSMVRILITGGISVSSKPSQLSMHVIIKLSLKVSIFCIISNSIIMWQFGIFFI